MNISKYILVCILFPFLFGCQSSKYPPSSYIGIFDKYQGYKNGNLPKDSSNYTGYWQYCEDDGSKLEGFYVNGIPSGRWVSTHQNGIPFSIINYGENGKYESISYFNDGLPSIISRGTYKFKNNEYTRNNELMISFDESGNIVNKTLLYKSRIHGTLDIHLTEDELECDFEGTIFNDNKISVMIYVYPKGNDSNIVAKVKLRAFFDIKTNLLSDVKELNYYGDFTLKPMVNSNGVNIDIYYKGKHLIQLPTLSKESFLKKLNSDGN